MNLPLVVAITGASGVLYGVELLRVLNEMKRPAELIISESGRLNLTLETGFSPEDVEALASRVHHNNDMTSPLASGSFLTSGMVVAPCTVRTLSAIVNSYNHNLVVRSGDVHLKERRPLILMVRETPLHKGHLELMLRATEMGAIILPPLPAFYHNPKTINDLVLHSVGKVLDLLGVDHELFKRWNGV